MKKIVLAFSLIALFMSSCAVSPEVIDPPTGNKINFADLRVGQKSVYVLWTSKNWRVESDTTFKQTTDSLSLAIVAQDDWGFKIAETRLNTGAPVVYYYLKVEGDSLSVRPQPQMSFIGSTVFWAVPFNYLLKENGQRLMTLNRWQTPTNEGVTETLGRAENIRIQNQTYTSALIHFHSRSIIVDGPTIVHIYAKDKGFISFQNLGSMFPEGSIWNLVP